MRCIDEFNNMIDNTIINNCNNMANNIIRYVEAVNDMIFDDYYIEKSDDSDTMSASYNRLKSNLSRIMRKYKEAIKDADFDEARKQLEKARSNIKDTIRVVEKAEFNGIGSIKTLGNAVTNTANSIVVNSLRLGGAAIAAIGTVAAIAYGALSLIGPALIGTSVKVLSSAAVTAWASKIFTYVSDSAFFLNNVKRKFDIDEKYEKKDFEDLKKKITTNLQKLSNSIDTQFTFVKNMENEYERKVLEKSDKNFNKKEKKQLRKEAKMFKKSLGDKADDIDLLLDDINEAFMNDEITLEQLNMLLEKIY